MRSIARFDIEPAEAQMPVSIMRPLTKKQPTARLGRGTYVGCRRRPGECAREDGPHNVSPTARGHLPHNPEVQFASIKHSRDAPSHAPPHRLCEGGSAERETCRVVDDTVFDVTCLNMLMKINQEHPGVQILRSQNIPVLLRKFLDDDFSRLVRTRRRSFDVSSGLQASGTDKKSPQARWGESSEKFRRMGRVAVSMINWV
jgi:hypothetical protein